MNNKSVFLIISIVSITLYSLKLESALQDPQEQKRTAPMPIDLDQIKSQIQKGKELLDELSQKYGKLGGQKEQLQRQIEQNKEEARKERARTAELEKELKKLERELKKPKKQ